VNADPGPVLKMDAGPEPKHCSIPVPPKITVPVDTGIYGTGNLVKFCTHVSILRYVPVSASIAKFV
jgi:hypothetical protein